MANCDREVASQVTWSMKRRKINKTRNKKEVEQKRAIKMI